MPIFRRLLAGSILLIAMAGCASNTSVPSPATPGGALAPAAAATPNEGLVPVAGDTAPVTFSLTIPSPLAGVTAISITGGLLGVASTQTTGPCAPTGCSLVVTTFAGESAFTLALTSSTGAVLGAGTFSRFVLDAPQTVGLSYGGIVATAGFSADPLFIASGTTGRTQLALMAFDAGGNRIIGTGALSAPIGITASDNQSLAKLSGTAFTTPDQRITVSYAGSGSGAVTYSPLPPAGVAAAAIANAVVQIAPPNDTFTIAGLTEVAGGFTSLPNEMMLSFLGGRSFMNLDRKPQAAALPAKFDLLAQMPPIGMQNLNDCVGWSTSYATMSTIVAKRSGLASFSNPANLSQVYSPSFVYNQINGGVNMGSRIPDALALVRTRGDVPWATFPSNGVDFKTQPSASVLAIAASQKITDFTFVPQGVANVAQVKAAIFGGTPVVFGAYVDGALENLQSGQVWNNAKAPTPSGHAMALVGWDDGQNAFLVYNSWGTAFANAGVGLLSYSGWATGPYIDTWTVTP